MLKSNSSELNVLPVFGLLALMNHAYFHRFEPKSAGGPIFFLTVQPLLPFLAFGEPLSFYRVCFAYLSFFFALSSSIILYRISPWHPLAHIPGPMVNKVTMLWSVFLAAGGKQYRVNKMLHDKHGPFVRTGPNEVSIVHVDAVKTVLATSGFQKGQYYEPRTDPSLGVRSLLSLRGDAHANRRRIWNRGMSMESLNGYETILVKRITQLVARLEGLAGPMPVDMSKWLGYFTFDVMGDMAFGGGFEMVRDGRDKEGAWTLIEQGAKNISVMSQIPWIVPTLQKIPILTRGIRKLRKFGAACAANRIKSGSQVKDLWYHLTDEAGQEKVKPAYKEVVADGVLSVIAGSDTTSTALSCLVCLLLSNPEAYRRVQAEIDYVYPDGESSLDALKHSELQFLTACLNETLRLHPPVPTNGPRQSPRGGKLVAGRFIPEGTQIYIPHYSLHRRAEHFSWPEKFDPDRWLRAQQPGEVFNQAAFIPFSAGAANCVGMRLAWREMLMVTSTLLRNFNLRFADGFQPNEWLDELQDVFVTSIGGPLQVVISPR
ncbi:high nitrogen upregulated cytochrome P450 monooxygenase 2 [Mycena belliarum]|uniref:High nitrogen upregulated cytochrome P450 monooxygenase 2 n=1 Tax=Mycena belliarum TaxID=1033014 RepID=A0AAD6U073_9AGAR|nr:high nitrogen upregulated cytochrome P450 monooxygenase 2 [Mycena belliae]